MFSWIPDRHSLGGGGSWSSSDLGFHLENSLALEHRLSQLQHLWPDLEWSEARLEEYDHDVVHLDERWVFRFACKVREHEPLDIELALLDRVRDRIDLPIPNYTRVAPDFSVAGYERIPGTSVTLDGWDQLDRSAQEKGAADLAQLLNVVHSIPIAAFRALGGKRGKRPWPSWRKRFKRFHLIPDGKLTNSEFGYLTEQVREFQSLKRRALYQHFTVLQGDTDIEHILIDRQGVCRVIDFGDYCIADPAVDFCQYWSLGEDFVDLVLSNYVLPSEGLKQRSRWMFLAIAINTLSRAEIGDSEEWRRVYQIFPKEIAEPSRSDGYW